MSVDSNQVADVYLFGFDQAALTILSLNRAGTAAAEPTESPWLRVSGIIRVTRAHAVFEEVGTSLRTQYYQLRVANDAGP